MGRKKDSLSNIRQYEKTRYKGLDQRLVHSLEYRIVTNFIEEIYAINDNVLDVPSGYGRFTDFLLERPMNVVVADLNPNMLHRVYERFGTQARFANADIMNLPFRDDAFHGLLSMRLIQHFHTPEDRIRAFSEIRRVITEWAVVSVYTSSAAHKLMRFFRNHHKITMADEEQIEEEIREAGLKILDSKKILPGIHAQTILLLQPK
ncbi:MAG: class I SAM-dependent methyltransferase [Candidatus Marinimicrobia bacterium]|nr:class I SAM-dependent methyltransferase [Candidatus Neomarinimicrobiota bacterium]MCF7829242.1 class I SAM-dependent methyltransferase [Candidatus Neomarinimicrobiota bacterium]MCF7881105.1 class I SAM-dependent methyltransferase [Candidatus Neomarinimicrobiota bacterium]